MVTYADLFALGTFVVSIITLCVMLMHKKQQRPPYQFAAGKVAVNQLVYLVTAAKHKRQSLCMIIIPSYRHKSNLSDSASRFFYAKKTEGAGFRQLLTKKMYFLMVKRRILKRRILFIRLIKDYNNYIFYHDYGQGVLRKTLPMSFWPRLTTGFPAGFLLIVENLFSSRPLAG